MTAHTIIDDLVERTGSTEPSVDLDVSPVDAIISPNSIFDPAVKAMYDKEPKKRVYVPTPDNWQQPYPYAERIQINGIVYIIMADQDVLLPESVAAVWENKRQMEREVQRQTAAMKRLAQYTHIDQVPHWYR